MKAEDLPHPWCTATCPRQATHQPLDCECGGAEREWRHVKREQRQEADDRHARGSVYRYD